MLTVLWFFIIELLDRTLRDRMRSERITQVPVMGCYPKESNLRYRRFNKTIGDMAMKQLSKALLPHQTHSILPLQLPRSPQDSGDRRQGGFQRRC